MRLNEFLVEKSIETISDIKYFENPTHIQLKSLLRRGDVRGLIVLDSGNVYIWDAEENWHGGAAKDLSLDPDYKDKDIVGFYASDDPESEDDDSGEWGYLIDVFDSNIWWRSSTGFELRSSTEENIPLHFFKMMGQ